MADNMLPGADPIISPSITEQFVQHQAANEVNDIKMRMFALGAMYGEQKDRLRSIEENVMEVAKRVIQGAPVPGAPGAPPLATGGAQPPSASGLRQAPTGQPPTEGSGGGGSAPRQAPAYPAGTVLDSDGQPVTPGGGERIMPMTYSEGRRVGSSAAGIAGLGAKYLSQRTPSFQRDDDGGLVAQQYVFDPAVGPQQAYLQTDPRTGEVLQAIPADDPNAIQAVEEADQGSSRMRAATGALTRLGAGEGIMGALGGGAKAGAVGLAIGAAYAGVRKVGDFFADQQAAAAPYRQAYGEQAGTYALGQRAGRFGAGVEGFFSGVGSERAQQGYDVATRLGFTGERFEAATEFDTDMYKRFGMSSDQTGRFLALNAQDASQSLDELTTQIERVSSAAVDAGKNSSEAVETLIAVGDQLRNFSRDPSAQATAANLTTTALTNLPANLATDQNIAAMAGTLTDQNILMNATMTGADPYVALTQTYGSPDAQAASIEMTLSNVVRQVAQSIGMTPEQLRAEMESMFGGKPTSQAEYEQITARWYTINPMTLRQIGMAFGYQFTPGQEMELFIENLFGAFAGLHTPESGESGGGGIFDRLGDKFREISGPSIKEGTWDEFAKSTNDVDLELTGKWMGNEASDAYVEYGERTGNRNTAIERLLKHGEDLERDTGQDIEDIKFDTSKGEKTLTEIINDKALRAELVEGGVSANAKGGETIDISKYLGIDTSSTDTTVFDPEGEGGGGLGGGGYVLDLSPRAMELLQLRGPTDAQRSGVPPLGTSNPLSWRR